MAKFSRTIPLLIAFGILALGVAVISIGDMLLPRPYDGVVLTNDPDKLVVGEVIPGSGAESAGIEPGDVILGIARELVHDKRHAASMVNQRFIGEEVPYWIESKGKRQEIRVKLDRRRVADGSYLYVCIVGLSFLLIGTFVLIRQPMLKASQVFFVVCGLALMVLVCRMRPASYAGIDAMVLEIGSLATMLVPAALLHLYLIFPRPAWLDSTALKLARKSSGRGVVDWLKRVFWPAIYALPIVVYAISGWLGAETTIAGLSYASAWLVLIYLIAGLLALAANAVRLENRTQRRGTVMVLIGSVLGLTPLVVAMVLGLERKALFWFGIVPLVLLPLAFTYAIVRFQLLDIRIILKRSLLYTLTTVVVTVLYAGAIAVFSSLMSGGNETLERYTPFILALTIVLLFEPLRRRLQEPIDRFFFAEESKLRQAAIDLGEALTAQVDPQAVVQELVEALPRLAKLEFAALFLLRGDRLQRMAGPTDLPDELPLLPKLQRFLESHRGVTRIDQLGMVEARAPEIRDLVRTMEDSGVEAIGDLASRRRWLGLVMLSGKEGQMSIEADELALIQGLLHQASLALETGLLLEERTERIELERELEIAARIQADLHPGELRFAPGWRVSALCRPAKDIGGDFFTQLPGEQGGNAVVFGDVSGKSVSGALMMMAAHEALHALAMTDPHPERLFDLTNRRLYQLGRRRFVALAYLATNGNGKLRYVVAGQPPLLLRRAGGDVVELPLPGHRIPIGALPVGSYEALESPVAPGEMVLGYSDGIPEAMNPSGEFFGMERLAESLARGGNDPARVVRAVRDAVDHFTAGAQQYDDLTLIAVSRDAPSPDAVTGAPDSTRSSPSELDSSKDGTT